jgi:hypothetical protein
MKGLSMADEFDELADDTDDAAELVKVLVDVEVEESADVTDDKTPLFDWSAPALLVNCE